ncbi:MAG: dTDP-glucose 4,6-dehydratase [Elusimicrobia bacterium]|nr:dTDP-glucose 4,6-dehydratase [Elusimicrobiota bacterium]
MLQRGNALSRKFKSILVTGGAGFIGSEFVRQAVKKRYEVLVVDKLTYAGDLERLKSVEGKYKFFKSDICNEKKIRDIFKREKPDAVAHFAAETHVDRSITDATPFMKTNVIGTQSVFSSALAAGVKKIVHISTDEIYGEIRKGKFTENSPIAPNSPYSASKAAADMLAKAYFRTYALPVVIARPSNNYGPWQFPEKLIPVIIKNALENRKVPVYAKGENVREWLYVCDCAEAIFAILEKGDPGQAYNIGSGQERKNIEVVKSVLKIMGKSEKLIEFVKDRPGHDFRYSLNIGKIKKRLGWKAKTGFGEGIKRTVRWYEANRRWLRKSLNA